MSYARFCYRLLYNYVKPIRKHFLDLKYDLNLASMRYTLEEYIAMALFTSLLTFVVESALFAFIFAFIFDVAFAVLLSLLLSFAISLSIFFAFYSYPTTLARSRGEKIDKELPFAVSYMAAVASGSKSLLDVFETIANLKEYKNVARHCANIARNMRLGMSASDAIRYETRRIPSREFRELLFGINTTLKSGASLHDYLRDKANALVLEHRRKIRRYSQDLSLFTEIYLTLIITGSIFFVVLTSIISPAVGLETAYLQSAMTFLFLPFSSLAFLIFAKLRCPR